MQSSFADSLYYFLCMALQINHFDLAIIQESFIILFISKLMFPQITKNKKKPKIGTDEMIKECDEIIKQVEYKHKKALKALPSELVSDFHKVCRLKDVRPFYSQYFFYFVHIASKQNIENYFAQQVQNIMLGRSYYQQIQSLLKDRASILTSIKQQLHVIEGFSIMNSGKNLPITLKGMINNLIKDCTSLEQVKTIETNEVRKLTEGITKARDNLKEISQMLISWEYKLRSFSKKNQSTSFKRMKIVFPENGINCIFLGLYDTQFIKNSILAQEMKFQSVQFDPFLLYIEPNKKTSKIFKENLIDQLVSKGAQYKKIQSFIVDSIPKNEKKLEQQKQKQKQRNKETRQKQKQLKNATKSAKKFYTLEKQKIKDRRKSEKKTMLNQYLGQTLIEGNNQSKLMMRNSINQINIDSILGIYKKKKKTKPLNYKNQKFQKSKSLSRSKSKSIQSIQGRNGLTSRVRSVIIVAERQVTVSSSDNRSRKSIGSIDKQKTMSKTLANIKKVDKIQNVYKMSSNKNLPIKKISSPKKKQTASIQLQNFKQEKEELLRQINKQKKEQETLQKIIKKVQNRTSSENRLYEKKMQEYENQIDLLKQRIRNRQAKYDKSSNNLKEQRNKHNDIISKVYQKKKSTSPNKIRQQGPEMDFVQSRMIEEKNANKMLQNKIKQLLKERNKLQSLITKEGDKANKQKEMYQRKLEKYQEIINSLKKQSAKETPRSSEPNRRFSLVENLQNLDESPKKSLSKQERLLKLYSKRQTIQSIGSQKVIKHRQSSDNATEKKLQTSQSILNNQSAFKKENKQDLQDLKITNNKNTIQIVYNPKKHKKSKKELEQPTISKLDLNLSRQKEQEYEKKLSKLQKQKVLLERKLEVKIQGKSGTQAVLIKKLQQSQQQLEKYREIVQKERNTNVRYDQRMKELRKKINQEYEQKIDRQRKRFEEEKQHLFYKLKQERELKMEKDKFLSKQMIFLKQMQMRQNQLLVMLENQRHQRQEKQRILQEQILQKQQVLQQYELQEIKRVIEKQVRQQMNLINQEEEKEFMEEDQKRAYEYEKTKAQVQQEIREILATNDYELREIDEENEKLKELIEKIKQEEEKIIAHLQTGMINQDEEENQIINTISSNHIQNSRLNTAQNQLSNQINRSRVISGIEKKENFLINLESQETPEERHQRILKELQHKSDLQLQTERLSNSRYKQLQESPVYKQRQKLENIIQHYLKNPHQYPSNNKIVLKPQEKTSLIEQMTLKSKKAKQFEQQLMELKNVQNFVPAERDDPISNHMLNLRQAYQNEEAEALRKVLFPAFNEQEKYNQEGQDLSFQSDEPPPPVTLGDHIKVHEDKYKENKQNKKPSKNFMAINRLKLLKIEEQKKEKERQQIEDEAKKKVRKMMYKAKKKEEKDLKQFLQIKKELQEKQRKRQQQLQRAKQGVQSVENNQIYNVKRDEKQQQNDDKGKNKEVLRQQNEFLTKNESVSNIENKKKVNKIKVNKDMKQVPIKSVSKGKIIEKNLEKSKQKEKNSQKSEVKQKEKQKQIKKDKDRERSTIIKKEQQNEDDNQFQSSAEKVIINQRKWKQKQIAKINEGQKNQNNSNEKNIKLEEKSVKQQGSNKQNIIKIEKKPQIEIKHNQGQQKDNKEITLQKESQTQNEVKDSLQDYYDDEFEDDEEDEPNEFIPKESQALKQLKEKLGEGKKTLSQDRQNKHQKDSQVNQDKIKKNQKELIEHQDQNNLLNQSQSNQHQQLSQNLPLMLLQYERSSLKQDLLSYQDQIRSYISSYSQFEVYQHYVQEKQLIQYIDEVLELSSQEIKLLNNNPTLRKDLPTAQSIIILVAKDKQTKLQLGIGIFHKEFQHSEYVCGYLLAHNMQNFLNLTFNFSRYIYQHDSFCHSIEYIFTISALQDQSSKNHFEDFENKCKRLGQIYLKGKQSSTRKYVLKRHLFEYINNEESFNEEKGVIFATKLQIHENLMKQKNQGYPNSIKQCFTSPTVLLSLYIKENPELLQSFKSSAQNDLKNRETLVTSMVFAKKQLTFKTVQTKLFDTEQKIQIYKNTLGSSFTVQDMQQQIQQIKFSLIQIPPKNFKRCILDINDVSTPYCMIQFEQALNRVQSSNSAQIGTFIPLVPKFKVLIIPAGQFLTSCSSNQDMNVFFYTKHFIKNITQVKKEYIPRVYLPEIKDENWTFFRDVSQKLKKTVFGRQKIQIGFESKINNSLILTPRHDDLVIERPFIISVLSGSIQRAIEGSPIFCRLIE